MLQKTLLRVRPLAAPVLILNAALHPRAQKDMAEIGIVPAQIILEPVGRNTAPALAAASVLHNDDDLLLILPSDHDIRNPETLWAAVDRAAPFAAQGSIIAFGIRPRRVETGFGYIRRGGVVADGLYHIDRFIEKPPYAVAKTLIDGGDCDWNSGIFLLSAHTARTQIEYFEPAMMASVKRAAQSAHRTHNATTHIIALGDEFSNAPARSIDVAIMEHSTKTLVMPIALNWSDLGTWPALLRRMAG